MEILKKYPKYKPSGIEWIGEIPEGWEVKKMKYMVDTSKYYQIGDGDHGSIKPDMYSVDGEIPYIRVQNLSWSGELVWEGMVYISSDVHNANLKSKIIPNDILIAKTGATIGKLAIIPASVREANTTSSVGKITVDSKRYNAKFILYSMKGQYFKDQIWVEASQKSAQPGFNVDDLIFFNIVSPLNIAEQTAIANYLDDKTAKIDSLIEKKKKLIELYKEERTAVINEAVTKGINPNVKLKDSGIEWLGQIPEHWKVKKLKYVAKLRDELIDDSDFKIAVENIESCTGKLVGIEEDKNYQGKLSAFRNGDTIFNKLRPYLHKVYYAEQDGGLFGELLIIYSLGELLPKFLFYKLFSKIFIDIVDGSTQGTKMPRANWNDFISLLAISFPKDKDEQHQIVQHIEAETKRIDSTISKIEKEIELLAEYRTALISEVVTGKIRP